MAEKISVIIITLNEEKNIARCLDAVSKVADEIIIVDSYSTDKTEEICSKYQTKFFENKFEGYIEQKTFAATLASNNWILSVDADEVLSPKLIQSILNVKENPVYDAYTVNRLSFYVNKFIKHGHWFPDKKIRLIKKGSGTWRGTNPHDRFVLNDKKKTPLLKGVLYHYTFYSISEHLSQANNFSTIGAAQLYLENKFFLILKALFSPVWGFFYGYIFRLGFLDGWYGLIIASISSNESFLKYLKAIVLINNRRGPNYDVMHISSMKTWRGGEQQVANLVLGQRKVGLKPILFISKDSALMHFCIKHKVPYHVIKFNNGYNILSALRIKITSIRLDIKTVHMHCSPSHSLAIYSKQFGNPAKLILSRRVIFPVRRNIFSYKKFNHSGIDNIICVSKSIQEVLFDTIEDKGKLKVVYDGISLEKFENIKPSKLNLELGLEGKKLIGNISAISAEKDHYTFVNVAEKVIRDFPNSHFLIAGSGKEKTKIYNYILSKNLNDNITMLGFRTDVPEILALLDISLITSTMEGLGTTILDSFASKVPVVATAVGGIPEMIEHEVTGMLSEPKDVDGLSQSIIRLLNDKPLTNKITNNAYDLVTSKFNDESMVKLTNEIYRNNLIES